MLLLVNGATTTVQRHAAHSQLGRLIQPRSHNSVMELATCGLEYGADNDALAGVDPDALLNLWDDLKDAIKRGGRRPRFVTAPDAVEVTANGPRGDWQGTLWLWRCWRPALLRRGLPAAIVAQDGARPDTIPWDEIDALFIGGSTRWKLSKTAARIARSAKLRGKWVHVGRVNSMGRLARIEAMDADSFDGGQFSMFPDTYIPRYLARLEHRQEYMQGVL